MRYILSLFDGMSTLQLAMRNLNISFQKYYASEIKKHAIKLTQYHFPDTIQLGDIKNWRNWNIEWDKIDFIGSGSPCQDLSRAGKKKGINGNKSSLFFIFVDILNHIRQYNPNILFLQENVASMSSEDKAVISEYLEVNPVMIDSALLTAQMRKRYYWTNIRVKENWFGSKDVDIPQPEDKKILLKDIIEYGFVDRDKAVTILRSESRPEKTQQSIKNRKDKGIRTVVITGNGMLRLLTQIEFERLQGFPDGYTKILSRNQAADLLGDGWTLPVIEYILSFIPDEKR